MCRVETNPCAYRPLPWPDAVAAAGPCPAGGLNEHRLVERPVLNTLLEHLPGDVPYSTHVEIEAARARLAHRALTAALDGMGSTRVDYGRLAAHEATQRPRLELPPVRKVPAAQSTQGVVYTVARRKWPIGGLVDLIV